MTWAGWVSFLLWEPASLSICRSIQAKNGAGGMASRELPVFSEDAVPTWQLTVVYHSSPKGSNAPFKLPRAPDTCVSKMFTHIKKKSTTSHKLAPTSFTSQTIHKGQRLLALCKHPEILKPIIGHSVSSNPDVLSQIYKPKFQLAQMPFSLGLPRSLCTKPSPPAVISFASL